jgi:hypothetical protein
MSFLSTQYGWAANNVVSFEVVLANGTVVNANAKENTGRRYAHSNHYEPMLIECRPFCFSQGWR